MCAEARVEEARDYGCEREASGVELADGRLLFYKLVAVEVINFSFAVTDYKFNQLTHTMPTVRETAA